MVHNAHHTGAQDSFDPVTKHGSADHPMALVKLPAAESSSFDSAGNRNSAGGGSSSADGTFSRVQNDGTYSYAYGAEGNQVRCTKICDGPVVVVWPVMIDTAGRRRRGFSASATRDGDGL